MALSLFERAAKAGVRVHMLDTQYRSHPAISQFPAAYFYRGELKDAPTLSSLSRPLPPGFAWPKPQWPVAFLSVEDGQENAVGTSYVNHAEALVVAEVVAQIAVLQVLAPEVVLRILALVYLVHRVPVVVPAALWVFVV